jgi:hypothetical protein
MDAVFMEQGGYYRITYQGIRTYAAIITLIDEMVANAEKTGVYKCLFDLRRSEEGFSMLDKYDLGIHLAKVFGSRYTIAVLIRREHITGFLENVSSNRGAVGFVITDDEGKARAHLGGSP